MPLEIDLLELVTLILVSFLDLKKLIKYESSPRVSTEVHVQAGPSSVNIQRLFEAHTISSNTKQKEKAKEISKAQKQQQTTQTQPNVRNQPINRPATIVEVPESKEHKPESADKDKQSRVKSADAIRRRPSVAGVESTKEKPLPVCQKKTQQNRKSDDKENIPSEGTVPAPAKSKMWIRPKSASQATRKTNTARKTDPVSLYQAYQKDWEKFKTNICESSHSDLRWKIREKMMGNH